MLSLLIIVDQTLASLLVHKDVVSNASPTKVCIRLWKPDIATRIFHQTRAILHVGPYVFRLDFAFKDRARKTRAATFSNTPMETWTSIRANAFALTNFPRIILASAARVHRRRTGGRRSEMELVG
jgi:heme/copper-type cytochrome/quinol oxidase subunit 1